MRFEVEETLDQDHIYYLFSDNTVPSGLFQELRDRSSSLNVTVDITSFTVQGEPNSACHDSILRKFSASGTRRTFCSITISGGFQT